MGLETATYIHELVATNPVGASDQKQQGDNHLRLIKETLQNTFPNVEGEITATHTEINKLAGATLSTAELNTLTGITANVAELNTLDGITASVTELNLLDGVTATTAELNKVDGVTTDLTKLVSGSYTPSTVATANCTINATFFHQYSRVDNVVTVAGSTQVNVTSAAAVAFRVPLPIATNLTGADCTGGGGTNKGHGVYAFADTANDAALVNFLATSTGLQDVYYVLQYQVH